MHVRSLSSEILHPYWKYILAIVIVQIFGVLAQIDAINILKPMLNIGAYEKDLEFVWNSALMLIILTIVMSAAMAISSLIASKVASSLSESLRMRIMRRSIELQNLDSLKGSTTDTMTALTTDVSNIQMFAFVTFRNYLPLPFLLIALMCCTFYIDVKIGLVMLVMMAVLALVSFILILRIRGLYLRQVQSIDDLNTLFRQKVVGAKTIRAYNGFEYEKSKFEEGSAKLGAVNSKLSYRTYFIPNITTAAMWLVIVFILVITGLDWRTDETRVVEIVLFMQYISLIVSSLVLIPYFLIELPKAYSSHIRIGWLMEEARRSSRGYGDVHVEEGDESLSFIDVSSKDIYGTSMLEGVNLSIRKGEVVSIVGPNGSGSSEVISILLGFNQDFTGKATVMGMDVRDTDPRRIRINIAYAGFGLQVIPGTIRMNIDPHGYHSDDEIMDVCEEIGLADHIRNLPDGLDTKVDNDNPHGSGGQIQQIIIARCLLKDSSMFVFDNCFFSLDAQSKTKALNSIMKRTEGSSVLFVTHDMMTCGLSDRIIIMDDGRVIDSGTHDSLVILSKLYRDLTYGAVGGS